MSHKKTSYSIAMSIFRVPKIKVPTNESFVGASTSDRDISGTYDMLDSSILGKGAFGTVVKCSNRLNGTYYAVKTIDKLKIQGKLDYKQEIDVLREVNHPNILSTIDYFEDYRYLHIITELYSGGDLFDFIDQSTMEDKYGCLSERNAISIMKALLESIRYLHDKNIVHRDIKPENVLFSSNPYNSANTGSLVRLVDFGFSKYHGLHDQRMRTKLGSPYYMSPDILNGSYDRSVDLWSAGVVCYIMLCGYPPFSGDTDSEIYDAIKKGIIVFEEEIWGDLSIGSKLFVRRLLSSGQDQLMDASTAVDCMARL